MVDIRIRIHHPNKKESNLYVDGQLVRDIFTEKELTEYRISIEEGKHHIYIQQDNILNTKFWWIRSFVFLKRKNGLLMPIREVGYDGYFSQIEFDLIVNQNMIIDISLEHKIFDINSRTESDYYFYSINMKRNKEIKNINYEVEVSKKYLTRWRFTKLFALNLIFVIYQFLMILNLTDYYEQNNTKEITLSYMLLFAAILIWCFIIRSIVKKKSNIIERNKQ